MGDIESEGEPVTATLSPALEKWDTALATWEELEASEGWRTEIVNGEIVMSPAPGVAHGRIASKVHRACAGQLNLTFEVVQNLGVRIDSAKMLTIPDLIVVDDQVLVPGLSTLQSENIHLAVEITSGNAARDRKDKLKAYAQGGIPWYLLIDEHDRRGPGVTLYSDPVDGLYRKDVRVPFGEMVLIGSPLNVKIDTGMFTK